MESTNTMFYKLIKLISILYSRKKVSRDQLIKECGVTKRSIYRYIRILSEADIPVYYDRKSGYFRLNNIQELNLNCFSVSDISLIRFALWFLNINLDGSNKQNVYAALEKTGWVNEKYSNFPFFKEDMENKLKTSYTNIGELLNLNLIWTAIEMSKEVHAFFEKEKNDELLKLIYKNPKLYFQNEWFIADRLTDKSNSNRVRNIVKLNIF